ncbi:MAG TPA: hypothetical protein PK056_08145 [Methylotenera sp.]|nr:hypothetical protein [Methylotenera sp.]
MNEVAKIARMTTWGIFLLVSLVTAGQNLTPEPKLHIASIFRTALFFSGIPLVAVAEFHIQRFEIRQSNTPVGLILVLFTLLISYFVTSAMAIFVEIPTSWGLLVGWLFIFVGLPSLRPNGQLEQRLLIESACFIILGAALLLLLSLWLWPEFFYNYLRPNNHLKWTPYFMLALGLVFWGTLLAFNSLIKRVAQQFT